tara:strand:- start:79248 stop:79946 length:699 start_codon:yes stop_codon:yes gene_type:complete
MVPQMRAIRQEFYLFLKKLNPYSDNLVEIKRQSLRVHEAFNEFKESCSEGREDCFQKMQNTYSKSKKLDLLILDLNLNKIKFNWKDMNKQTELIGLLDTLMSKNYSLLHSLEEFLITYQTTYFPYVDNESRFGKKVYDIKFAGELILTVMFSGKLRNDIDSVLNQFFLVTERIMSSKDGPKLMANRLEELNIAWNTFHMVMTKGNHNLPKSLINTIKIMHNRWNSILKIALK